MIYSKGKTQVEPASDSLLAFFPVGEISARAEQSKRLWLNDYGIHLSVSKALDLDLPCKEDKQANKLPYHRGIHSKSLGPTPRTWVNCTQALFAKTL